jgi:hypothetical protein
LALDLPPFPNIGASDLRRNYMKTCLSATFFSAEQSYLMPLPRHVPEVYQLCTRIVDAEGHVHVNRVRYSAQYRLIGHARAARAGRSVRGAAAGGQPRAPLRRLLSMLQNLKLKTIVARFDEMLAAAEQNGTPTPKLFAQL